jgi:hypothetical protein
MLQDTCYSSLKDFLEKLTPVMKSINLSFKEVSPGSIKSLDVMEALQNEHGVSNVEARGYLKILSLTHKFFDDMEDGQREKRVRAMVRPYPPE